MDGYGYRPKKRYRIKYKNVAILLAILLLIILLITKGCSALFSKDKEKEDDSEADVSQSEGPDVPDDGVSLTDDPTKESSYFFRTVKVSNSSIGDGTAVLVNNKIKFLGTVNEDELSVVRAEKDSKAYSVKDYTVLVRPEAMKALNEMLVDFYNVTGRDGVMVNAGYRTLEYQQELYDDDLEKTGQEYSTLVAMPGYSEHHTGLAVDFTVYENGKYDQSKISEGDYQWIYENSWKYGFVNRYPAGKESITMIDNEPWHFRYVGKVHAAIMHKLDYCLEEYIDYIKNFTIRSGFESVDLEDGSQYIVYYIPQSKGGDTTDIFIPEKDHETKELYPYEISGNNVDGWIVSFLYKEGTGVTVPEPMPDEEPEVTAAPEDGDGEATTAPDENE